MADTLSKCFPLTKKNRARALRLYLGAKRFGLRAEMVVTKWNVCVRAHPTKRPMARKARARMHRVQRGYR